MKDKIPQIRDMFYRQGLPPCETLQEMLTQPLKKKSDFAEIYVQHSTAKHFKLSERKISDIAASYVSGAGIRVIKGNNTGYSYTENLSPKTISRCIKEAAEIAGSSQPFVVGVGSGTHDLYNVLSSIAENPAKKVDILRRAEKKAFSLSPLVEIIDLAGFQQPQRASSTLPGWKPMISALCSILVSL